MKNKKIAKLLTRKDVRERYTREEAKQLFQWCIDKSSKDNPYPHSKEEIEKEIDIIYNSSLEELFKEDEEGLLIFGEKSPWPHGIHPIS